MEPIYFRGLERLLVVVGAIFISFLGYKLYAIEIHEGRAEAKAESGVYKFALSAVGLCLF